MVSKVAGVVYRGAFGKSEGNMAMVRTAVGKGNVAERLAGGSVNIVEICVGGVSGFDFVGEVDEDIGVDLPEDIRL